MFNSCTMLHLALTKDGVPIRKLFISNLAKRTTYKDLIKLFSKYGTVVNCYLRRNQGKSNYAFVTFSDVEGAVRATYEETLRLHNRNLRVFPADSWHQPDNIENQYYSTKDKLKSEKISSNEQCDQENTENEDFTNSSIQILNDYCLMYMFLQLPIVDRIRIERVCKRWRALSQESWHSVKKLDLSHHMWGSLPGKKRRDITEVILRKVLLRCGPFLNEINLAEIPYPLNRSAVTIIGKLCPNLQRIDITGIPVSAFVINSLMKNCHDITKFSLGVTFDICDKDLQQLFKVNPKLRYFKAYYGIISGMCLFHLPLETMEEIVLEYCTSLKEHFLSQAITKLQNLKSLTIKACDDISGNVINAICTSCTNLKTLELCNIPFAKEKYCMMLQIAKLTNLEVLNISMNRGVVSDELLSDLASNCLQLTYIDITACCPVTNVGIAAIASLPKLEVLIMNNLHNVMDVNLRDACNLKILECRACKFTDRTVTELIECAPQLKLLDLSGCWGITNLTLQKAAAVTINRTNNTILKIFVGGTTVDLRTFDKVSPFLQVVNVNLNHH
ncbi:Putative RNA-binding protein EEED8.10 [Anthophora quadrimaculata]